MQILAGPERRDPLRLDYDFRASARIATYASITYLGGECSEATQLHAAAVLQCLGDFVQDGVHDTI